jgi:hypothetical protein
VRAPYRRIVFSPKSAVNRNVGLGCLLVPSSPVKRSRLVAGGVGISVEQSAHRLQVSPPTIRKWIGEGLLDAIPGRKPVEVDPRSVVAVERVLENVKKSYPSREWTRALAAFLHDRDLAQTLGIAEAIEENKRAEYVDR